MRRKSIIWQCLYILFCLSLLFIAFSIKAQSINWTTGNELSVTQYQIESTTDTLKTWSVLQLVAKGQSSYSFAIPNQPIYFRVHAVGLQDFFTPAMLLSVSQTNTAVISQAKVSTRWWTDKLTWTVSGGNNVNYYLLEYSSGINWVQLSRVGDRGNISYSYSRSRNWFSSKPSYRITTIFKDNSKSSSITFK
jgi:hypothetical protein